MHCLEEINCNISISLFIKHSLNKKVVHIYMDNESCKYMLINVRAKLSRPDLQLIINEIRKICMQHGIIPWVEHIPCKQSIIPDALSRNKPIPNNLVHNCRILISTTNSVQLAADSCRDMIPNEKHSCYG